MKFASTNQKHCPDLGSDASSVWNFCARFSAGKPVVASRDVGCFLRLRFGSPRCKGIKDSLGFWILCRRLWINFSLCHWNLNSGFQSLVEFPNSWAVFRIPQAKFPWIPDSGFLYMDSNLTLRICSAKRYHSIIIHLSCKNVLIGKLKKRERSWKKLNRQAPYTQESGLTKEWKNPVSNWRILFRTKRE